MEATDTWRLHYLFFCFFVRGLWLSAAGNVPRQGRGACCEAVVCCTSAHQPSLSVPPRAFGTACCFALDLIDCLLQSIDKLSLSFFPTSKLLRSDSPDDVDHFLSPATINPLAVHHFTSSYRFITRLDPVLPAVGGDVGRVVTRKVSGGVELGPSGTAEPSLTISCRAASV